MGGKMFNTRQRKDGRSKTGAGVYVAAEAVDLLGDVAVGFGKKAVFEKVRGASGSSLYLSRVASAQMQIDRPIVYVQHSRLLPTARSRHRPDIEAA